MNHIINSSTREKVMEKRCFLCNAQLDAGAKQYSRERAVEAWEAGLQKPGMGLSFAGDYFACRSCSAMLDRGRNGLWKLLGSVLMFLVFLVLTWLQIARFLEESYWMIFLVWFIPIPAILLTGAGMLLALYFFGITLAAVIQALRRFREHYRTK